MEVTGQAANTILTDLTEIAISSVDPGQLVRFEQAVQAAHLQSSERGIGSDIVQSISEFRQDYHTAQRNLNEKLNQPEITVAQLMAIQHEMMKHHLAVDLLAKTVGRTTQNAETLLKMQ